MADGVLHLRDVRITDERLDDLVYLSANLTLIAEGWIGNSAPYSQLVNSSKLTASANAEIYSIITGDMTEAEQQAYMEAYKLVSQGYATMSDGSVTFYVFEKPATSIDIKLKWYVLGKGGGGVPSDELTATAEDVLAGATYVGNDTNDEKGTGTLTLTGSANVDDVIANKTFYNTNAKIKQTGTLALTGSATSTDVLSGQTFYNTDAKSKQTGTLALSGNATTADVITGKTFYSTDAKTKQTGALALSGNAAVNDVIKGQTFYNIDPKSKQTGTLELTGTATTGDVLSGMTFYNTNAKSKQTGTLALSGNATPSDVVSGKTFYSTNAKSRQTGTLSTTLSGNATAFDVLYGRTFYNTSISSRLTGSFFPYMSFGNVTFISETSGTTSEQFFYLGAGQNDVVVFANGPFSYIRIYGGSSGTTLRASATNVGNNNWFLRYTKVSGDVFNLAVRYAASDSHRLLAFPLGLSTF